MRPDRTLRAFLRDVAPPVIVPRERELTPPPPPFGIHQFDQPVIVSPAPGDAELGTQARFPGSPQGYPTRVQDRESPLASGWPRLARGGQAIGKTSNFRYDAAADVTQKGIETLRVEGSDLDACQMCITLNQPAISFTTLAQLDEDALVLNPQAIQGFQTNDDIDPASDFPGTGTPPAWAPITAWVQWGVGGLQMQAFVDWVQGATIRVTGSYVSVTPVALVDALNRPGQSALYRVGGNVGPGWSPGAAHRTIFIGTVVNGAESTAFPIPPFARKATVLGYNDASPPVLATGNLRFWQRGDGTRGVGDIFFNANQPQGFDVPNAAAAFSVFNGSGSDLGFAVIFELSI